MFRDFFDWVYGVFFGGDQSTVVILDSVDQPTSDTRDNGTVIWGG